MINKLKLLLKHLWLDASDAQRAVPPEVMERLTKRVAASESRHTGQVRICVEAALPMSYLWRLESRPGRSNALSQLIRQRALMMMLHLASAPKADPALLVYLDRYLAAVAARPELADATRAVQAELLIARDQPAELEKLYRTWLALPDQAGRWTSPLAKLLAEQGKIAEAVALLEARGNDLDSAEASFASSISLAEQQGALSWRLRTELSLARLRRRQGVRNPIADLAKTHARFSEGFETADLKAARAMLDEGSG